MGKKRDNETRRRIVAAAERLRYVQIECRPALDILRRYAGADVLISGVTGKFGANVSVT